MKFLRVCLAVVICLLFVVAPAQAATHPSLVVDENDVASIKQRAQSVQAVKQALAAMQSQSWKSGAPQWALDEGWSRTMVEQAFVGFVNNDPQATNQAKALFLIHTQGTDIYDFDRFDQETQKYQYGQPCTALALSYDLLEPNLSAGEKTAAQQFLATWGRGLYGYYQDGPSRVAHNFHTSSVACLGLIGLTLNGEVDQANTWSTFASNAFSSYFVNSAYNPGGDYTEGYVYQQYGLPSAVLFLNALDRLTVVDFLSHSNLANLWQFYLAAYGSDGSFPQIGDNSGGPFIAGTDLYLLNKTTKQGLREQYLWEWYQLRGTGASQQLFPYLFKDFDHLGMVLYFPDLQKLKPASQAILPSFLMESATTGTTQGATQYPGGMAVLRSEWSETGDNTMLWLNNRWRWQNHQHYDPNSFTLEGYGETLISNFNNRTYDDPLRGKWSQQNTVRINPTAPDGDAPISPFVTGSSSSLGTFPTFFRSELGDIVISDSRYSHANLQTQNLPDGFFGAATTNNVTPIDRASRTVLLVRNLLPAPFYLMFDDFKKAAASEYWWQVYIPNAATKTSGKGSMAEPFQYQVGDAMMRMSFLNQEQPQLSIGGNELNRNDHPIDLKLKQSQLQLLTALLPARTADPAPQLRLLQQNPTVYEISLDGQAVQVVFNPEQKHVVYDDFETDAVLAVGKDWTNSNRQILFDQVTYAKIGGTVFFQTELPKSQTIPGGNPTVCTTSADINGDGKVSLLDYTALIPNLFQTVTQDKQKFDLNCDQAIDLKDITKLFTSLSF
ncbi:hypothetical protein KC921_03045 [Candidatus Woesebacteria bacterium]|nr:hypothetical protein [Candidatus Woesebacteria bacterium]